MPSGNHSVNSECQLMRALSGRFMWARIVYQRSILEDEVKNCKAILCLRFRGMLKETMRALVHAVTGWVVYRCADVFGAQGPLEQLGEGVEDKDRCRIVRRLEERQDCLFWTTRGTADVPPVAIPLRSGYQPKRFNPRPLSDAYFAKVQQLIADMTANGVIEQVEDATHISPIHLVVKPPRRERLVIDYRHVNTGIADDVYPLPHFQEQSKELTCFCVSKLGIAC